METLENTITVKYNEVYHESVDLDIFLRELFDKFEQSESKSRTTYNTELSFNKVNITFISDEGTPIYDVIIGNCHTYSTVKNRVEDTFAIRVLDLSSSEEELLYQLRVHDRYNLPIFYELISSALSFIKPYVWASK